MVGSGLVLCILNSRIRYMYSQWSDPDPVYVFSMVGSGTKHTAQLYKGVTRKHGICWKIKHTGKILYFWVQIHIQYNASGCYSVTRLLRTKCFTLYHRCGRPRRGENLKKIYQNKRLTLHKWYSHTKKQYQWWDITISCIFKYQGFEINTL
jgi:hypothetical protein